MYKINFDRLWIRGDTHSNFSWLTAFCKENQTTYNDALIITGDHGFLYYGEGNWREENIKKDAAKCKITIICLRGNHEDRPQNREICSFANWKATQPRQAATIGNQIILIFGM